jgi:hypothetical protein
LWSSPSALASRHELWLRSAREEATTEDLRQAMRHYRSLFEELLADSDSDKVDAADGPLAREPIPETAATPAGNSSGRSSGRRVP